MNKSPFNLWHWVAGWHPNLGVSLALNIGAVITLASAFLFVGLYRQEEQRAMLLIHKQAESLLSAMVVVREWVSSYQGVWTTSPGEKYYEESKGRYLKTPAMVTKELSHLSDTKGYYRFHITSLKPVNPENKPDDFEHHALMVFENKPEAFSSLEWDENGQPLYRLMIPLKTETSCLQCHGDLGYQEGDVRGGLSILLPMDEINASLVASRQSLAVSALGISVLVMTALYFLVYRVVVLPVRHLTQITETIGRGDYSARCQLETRNELQTLGNSFNQMTANLQASHQTLRERIEQRTLELASISEIAQIVSSPKDLQNIMNEALARIAQVTGIAGGAILLLENEKISPLASRNFPQEWLSTIPENAEALRQIKNGNAYSLPPGHNSGEAPTEKLVLVPMILREKSLGILGLRSTRQDELALETLQLMHCIGAQLAVAIENTKYHEQTQELAILEERQRISRELHDSLAQTLGWLNIKVEIMQDHLREKDDEKVRAELGNIHHVIREACYDVRESIDGLRAQPNEDIKTSMQVWIATFRQRSPLDIQFSAPEEMLDLPAIVSTELIRILQEGLTNIRKHARASHVKITLGRSSDFVELSIQDNGQGFDYRPSENLRHFGLRIMRERAERLGGTFELDTAPGSGAKLLAHIPLKQNLYSRS